MDFKDPTNKEELKNKINSTIEEYRDLLINLTDDPNTYKKSALPNASVKPLNLFMGI